MTAKRTVFSLESKVFLTELVRKHPIVADKTTSGPLIAKKREAWEALRMEFSRGYYGGDVTVQNLKDLWRNMKAAASKEIAAVRLSQKQTGGGPPEGKLSELSELVTAVEPGHFQCIPNSYDDDAPVYTLETTTSSKVDSPPGSQKNPTYSQINDTFQLLDTSPTQPCQIEILEDSLVQSAPDVSEKRPAKKRKIDEETGVKSALLESQQQYTQQKMEMIRSHQAFKQQCKSEKLDIEKEKIAMDKEFHEIRMEVFKLKRKVLLQKLEG